MEHVKLTTKETEALSAVFGKDALDSHGFSETIRISVSDSRVSGISARGVYIKSGLDSLRGLSMLRSIDLGDTQVDGSLTALCFNTHLEAIYLDGTRVHGSLRDLDCLRKLRVIDLRYTAVIGSLGDLSQFDAMEHLKLGNTTVTGELGSLSHMKNLQSIDLAYLKISGRLEGLTSFKALEQVNLSWTPIKGFLGAFSELTNLTHIMVAATRIKGKLGDIRGLVKLRSIDLHGTGVEGDMHAIEAMHDLEFWRSEGTRVTGFLDNFRSSKNLQVLNARRSSIFGSLAGIAQLENLHVLILDDTWIHGSLGSLRNLTLLRTLRLRATRVDGSLDSLRHHTNLEFLILGKTRVGGSLKSLKFLIRLRAISLKRMISQESVNGCVHDLSHLQNLETLWLGRNGKIDGSIDGLAALQYLRVVGFDSTGVSGSLAALAHLCNLTKVSLRNTSIQGTLDALSGHAKLEWLFLDQSRVSGDIHILGSKPVLSHLNLSSTLVTGCLDTEFAEAVPRLAYLSARSSRLTCLDFSDNHCDLPELAHVALSDTRLSLTIGRFFQMFQFCPRISVIEANRCDLREAMPSFSLDDPFCGSMDVVFLEGNNITFASIPCSRMTNLWLQHNPLQKACLALWFENVRVDLRRTPLKCIDESWVRANIRHDSQLVIQSDSALCALLSGNVWVHPLTYCPRALCQCKPGYYGDGSNCTACGLFSTSELGSSSCRIRPWVWLTIFCLLILMPQFILGYRYVVRLFQHCRKKQVTRRLLRLELNHQEGAIRRTSLLQSMRKIVTPIAQEKVTIRGFVSNAESKRGLHNVKVTVKFVKYTALGADTFSRRNRLDYRRGGVLQGKDLESRDSLSRAFLDPLDNLRTADSFGEASESTTTYRGFFSFDTAFPAGNIRITYEKDSYERVDKEINVRNHVDVGGIADCSLQKEGAEHRTTASRCWRWSRSSSKTTRKQVASVSDGSSIELKNMSRGSKQEQLPEQLSTIRAHIKKLAPLHNQASDYRSKSGQDLALKMAKDAISPYANKLRDDGQVHGLYSGIKNISREEDWEDLHDYACQELEELRDRSTIKGVSLQFILGDFKHEVKHKVEDARAQLEEHRKKSTKKGLPPDIFLRSLACGGTFASEGKELIEDKVDADMKAIEALADIDVFDANFIQLAGVLAKGKHSYGFNKTCPRDGELHCSIVDARNDSGRANQFLSWCWQYPMSTAINALEHWAKTNIVDKKETKVWWCFFCNNQSRILDSSEMHGTHRLAEIFGENLKAIGRMLIMMDRFDNPRYSKRIWCIFEVFIAAKEDIPCCVVTPPEQSSQLDAVDGIKALLEVTEVDAAKAEATVPADEKAIKELIEKEFGYERVNDRASQALVCHVIKIIRDSTADTDKRAMDKLFFGIQASLRSQSSASRSRILQETLALATSEGRRDSELSIDV